MLPAASDCVLAPSTNRVKESKERCCRAEGAVLHRGLMPTHKSKARAGTARPLPYSIFSAGLAAGVGPLLRTQPLRCSNALPPPSSGSAGQPPPLPTSSLLVSSHVIDITRQSDGHALQLSCQNDLAAQPRSACQPSCEVQHVLLCLLGRCSKWRRGRAMNSRDGM